MWPHVSLLEIRVEPFLWLFTLSYVSKLKPIQDVLWLVFVAVSAAQVITVYFQLPYLVHCTNCCLHLDCISFITYDLLSCGLDLVFFDFFF